MQIVLGLLVFIRSLMGLCSCLVAMAAERKGTFIVTGNTPTNVTISQSNVTTMMMMVNSSWCNWFAKRGPSR
jgi:hypothetical protein